MSEIERIEASVGKPVYFRFISQWEKRKLVQREFYRGKWSYNLVIYRDGKPSSAITYEMDRLVSEMMQGNLILTDDEFVAYRDSHINDLEQSRPQWIKSAIKSANDELDRIKDKFTNHVQNAIDTVIE